MERDGHIRLLPLHVANKIAAGEVVERPASVLKELLENSIDAGSTRIEATIVSGGRKLVCVRDDGCGMTREDALLSLERQATSKIRDVDDIEHIDTLGFRGEAIPSIASVSRFTLTTRRHQDEGGTRLTVNAGLLAEVKDCGAPPGTCIEVRDLFCNVPARRKFLRAFATEEAHIRATFTVNALAHPKVGFTLILDGREVYRLPPDATLEERIRDLFGIAFAESLISIDAADSEKREHSAVSVHGYIERPSVRSATRRDQFIFINGRPATAAAINYALREAYPRTRDEVRPAVVLFIDLPPGQVDVNVHPAKREVRFRRPADVREAIISTVSAALAPASPPPQSPPPSSSPDEFAVPFTTPIQTQFSLPDPPAPPAAPPRPIAPSAVPPPTASQSPAKSACDAEPPQHTLWHWFHFLAQTTTGYVLLETDAGLITLDPRAARERIAYERLLNRQVAVSQPLLIPETVHLPPGDSARIRSFKTDLESTGFAIEEFGRDVWKVDAVPDLVGGIDTSSLLASIAADISESGAKRGSARWRDELVARSVARSFAGSPTQLTPEAAVQLVEELAVTRMPYVTPRGKVIMVFTSNPELSRKFGR
ncbi:MAG: DNA mismatch repair endonuclease MutL [Kiritimatiellia bacterium]